MWGGRQWRYGSSAGCAATAFEAPSTAAHPAGRPVCSDADAGPGRHAGDVESCGSDSDEDERAFHRACRERYRGGTTAPLAMDIPTSSDAAQSQECTAPAVAAETGAQSSGGSPSTSTSVCSMPLTSESSVSSLEPDVTAALDVAEVTAGGTQVVAPPPRAAMAAAGPRRRGARFRQVSGQNRPPDSRPRRLPRPPQKPAQPQQVARPKRPRRQQHAQHPPAPAADGVSNASARAPRRPPRGGGS